MQTIAVIEKLEYVATKKDTFWVLVPILSDIFYKIKFKVKKSDSTDIKERFDKFLKKENCKYNWLETPDESYPEHFIYWCMSRESYISEEYHCFCAMLSAFLLEEGFEFKQRVWNEEIWCLDDKYSL